MSYAVRNDLRGWRAVSDASECSADEHWQAIPPASDQTQPVPQEVSRFQGRAALIQAGHMAAIQSYIDEPTTDIMVKEAWANVTVFRRQSPMILTVASVLNLSDEDLDNLFIAAHAIGDV